MSILGGIAGNLAGGSIGRAVVSLALDTAGYNSQLAKAKGETETATTGLQGGFDRFKLAAVAAGAVAGAAIVDFAKQSVDAAIEANAEQLKLANAIANSGLSAEAAIPAFQAQAAALRDLTGVDDDIINGGQSILVNMGLQQAQIEQLTPLVVDLSQKYGLDLTTAFKAVGKAVEGNTGGLARFIGPVEVGTTKAETFANVLEKLGATAGFAAEQAKAEPWRLLSAAFGEMQESVGRALLPAIQELVPAITDLVEAVSPVLTAAFQQATDTIGPLIEALANLGGMFDSAGEKGSRFSGFMLQLAGVNAVVTDVYTGQTDILTDLHQAWDGTTAAVQDSTSSTLASKDAWVDFAEAQAKATQETEKATQALQENRLEQLKAAGGLLGLVTSLQDANEAQRTINQLQKQGKTNTREFRDAVIDATSSTLDFRSAVREYVADNPNRSISQTKQVLREMATQAGITGQQFRNALGGALDDIGGKVDSLRSKVAKPMTVTVNTSMAEAGLDRLRQQLARLS